MAYKEIYETVVEYIRGDDYITVSSQDRVWINKVKKLYAANPDEIQIVAINDDGSICARLPKGYLKLSKPRSRGMSEETKAAMSERLKKARSVRFSKA